MVNIIFTGTKCSFLDITSEKYIWFTMHYLESTLCMICLSTFVLKTKFFAGRQMKKASNTTMSWWGWMNIIGLLYVTMATKVDPSVFGWPIPNKSPWIDAQPPSWRVLSRCQIELQHCVKRFWTFLLLMRDFIVHLPLERILTAIISFRPVLRFLISISCCIQFRPMTENPI